MDSKTTLKTRILAGVLSVSVVAGLLAAIVALATPDPTIHIDGLELRMVADYVTDDYGQLILNNGQPQQKTDSSGQPVQSIQALVAVSISDMGSYKATGIELPLHFNTNYLTPSDWKTNGVIDETKLRDAQSTGSFSTADASDALHRLFFRVDEDLYDHEDPFAWATNLSVTSEESIITQTRSDVLFLQLSTKGSSYTLSEKGSIGKVTWQTNAQGDKSNDYYIKVDGSNKTTLGTISFRVKDTGLSFSDLANKLQTLANEFNGSTNGRSKDGEDWLFETFSQTTVYSNNKLALHVFEERTFSLGTQYSRGMTVNNLTYNITVDSDDVLVKAEPIQKAVTINSYQAYTDGRVSDLALALQKYAEGIRTTYVSGIRADTTIYWGDSAVTTNATDMPSDAPGMLIQKDNGSDIYRFTWDPSSSTGYKFEQQATSGSTTTYTPVDPVSVFGYDPTGGHVYKVSQYYTYLESSGVPGSSSHVTVRKAYPIPIEVTLTVTPIQVIDATVDKETLTYPNDLNEIPGSYAGLNLAEDAKLTLDTTLNGVTPVLPISWTPGVLTGLTGTAGPGNTSGSASWPTDANAITAKTGVGTYSFATAITESQINLKYPWLTTTNANNYSFTAERVIVDASTPDPAVPEPSAIYTMTAEPFEVHKGDTVGLLRINVRKTDSNGAAVAMDSRYTFRVFTPDGVEVMVDPAFSSGSNQWFGAYNSAAARWDGDAQTDAYYQVKELGGTNGYEITISPGRLMAEGAAGTYQSNLEKLRRDINLGGWFGVQILEPTKTAWTDTITAYSRPRTNLYIESHVIDPENGTETTYEKNWFDYTGDNVGLMPFYSDSSLPTLVSLPADGSVAVRYDYFSGSQPGALRQFKVGSWTALGNRSGSAGNWKTEVKDTNGAVTTPAEIVTYGADLFARTYDYSNSGTVVNPDASTYTTGDNTDVADRKVKVRVQVQGAAKPTPAPNTNLLLTYEQSAGDAITYTAGGEVERVTFNTKKEGYTYQQVVTLTLTNTGTTEIKDIYIDVPSLAGASNKPAFTILSAPAIDLPAGASTTFQISYVPNLARGDYENIFTASNPVNILYDNGGSKTFEAVLKVTDSRIHRVNLVVHPGEAENTTRDMGDAQLVKGVTLGTVQDTYNSAGATNTYEKDDIFWVVAQPADEYQLLSRTENSVLRTQVYYYTDNDPTKAKVYLYEYPNSIPQNGLGGAITTDYKTSADSGERLFWGVMPDQAVTIHVHYYEPLASKLRLSDLHAYAWDSESDARDASSTKPYQWIENDPAALKAAGHEKDLLDSQENGYQVILFDPDIKQYTVVLQPEASNHDNVCGLSVTLRQLLTLFSGVEPDKVNQDIKPTVLMTLDDGADTRVGGEPATGNTDGPTDHYSMIFDAPKAEPGQTTLATKTVTIQISFDGASALANNDKLLDPAETLETVEYKVRFVRALDPAVQEAKHQSLPGNSPYGMIENDKAIVDGGKVADAKADFDVENRFRKAEFTPKVVTTNAMTEVRYWPEAWEGVTDYDRDPTALFIYLGKAFYDPGVKNVYNNAADLIDGVEVKRTLTAYYEMDTNATSAMARFNNGGVTALSATAIDLGTVPAVGGVIPGKTTTVGGNSYNGLVSFATSNIRPGVYQLTYTFPDYNDPLDTSGAHTYTKTLSFTRPLIILAPVGDVNANLAVDASDAIALRQRFSILLPVKGTDYALSANGTADSLLYTYRILDANNDRNINNVDADMIRRMKTFGDPAKLTEFYLPTHYTDPDQP